MPSTAHIKSGNKTSKRSYILPAIKKATMPVTAPNFLKTSVGLSNFSAAS